MCLFGAGNSIAGFLLPYYTESLNWFGVSDKDTIVCSTEFSLLLFTNNGHRLQTFQYFSETIVRLSVVCLEFFLSSGFFFFLNRFTFFKLHTVGMCTYAFVCVWALAEFTGRLPGVSLFLFLFTWAQSNRLAQQVPLPDEPPPRPSPCLLMWHWLQSTYIWVFFEGPRSCHRHL